MVNTISRGTEAGRLPGAPDEPHDPTHQYPRMINMLNWDERTKSWAMHAELQAIVERLIDDKLVLRQPMIYFKPAGGRGQGLHQDQK